MKKLKAIDLFAGIGGIRLGLEKAGFDVVFSNDCDKYCKLTFENYFQEPLDPRRIEDIPLEEFSSYKNIDLLAAGFPCQPFSLAGLKKGFSDPRGAMFDELVRVIQHVQPKSFLLENVKHLKSHNDGETLKYILKILREKLNYFVPGPQILNSKNYGVPQNRERIYIVGFKDKSDFNFPKGNINIPKLKTILERGVSDETYYLSQKYLDGLIRHKERHSKKGHGFGLEILDPEGISNTLVVGNMGRERNLIKDKNLKNKQGIRRLTIKECALLQGFPGEFPVSRTQAYRQLGNTVTVPVIEAISKKIKEALLSELRSMQYNKNLHIDIM